MNIKSEFLRSSKCHSSETAGEALYLFYATCSKSFELILRSKRERCGGGGSDCRFWQSAGERGNKGNPTIRSRPTMGQNQKLRGWAGGRILAESPNDVDDNNEDARQRCTRAHKWMLRHLKYRQCRMILITFVKHG